MNGRRGNYCVIAAWKHGPRTVGYARSSISRPSGDYCRQAFGVYLQRPCFERTSQCTRSTRHEDANPCTGKRPWLHDWGTIGQGRFRSGLALYLRLPLVCPELSKLQKVGLVNSNAVMLGPSTAPAAIVGARQVVLCLNVNVTIAWWGFAGLNLPCLQTCGFF